MTDNDTTTGAPGALDFSLELISLVCAYIGEGDPSKAMAELIEQRDAAIDARARQEARAAALEEVDLVLRRLRLQYGDMGHAIAAVRALATPDAAPEGSEVSDG